ncbi:unnamed protein product [Ectocarpus sp. CCAP 1310/34]|nr:unnamed protein product [Ectocarpus sp. CCAP 1310/34]
MRSRALSKATRSGARPLLFLSSKGIPNRHEIVRAFLESAGTNNGGRDDYSGSCGGGGGGRGSGNDGSSGGGDDGDRGRMGGWRRGGGTAAAAAAAVAAVRRRRLDELDERSRRRGRRWLLTLARFMARPREFELRRAAAVRTFTPQKFRQEWELFWELVDPVFDGLEKATKDLLQWKNPMQSLSVMTGLLLVAYHDLVRYAIPLALLANVAYIYGVGCITTDGGGGGGGQADLFGNAPRKRPAVEGDGQQLQQHTRRRSSGGRLGAEGDGSRRSRPPSPVPGSRLQRPAPSPSAAVTAGGTAPGVQRLAASSRMAAARGGGSAEGEPSSVAVRAADGEVSASASRGGVAGADESWVREAPAAGETNAHGQGASGSVVTPRAWGEAEMSRAGKSSGGPAAADSQRLQQQQQHQQEGGIISRVKGMQDRAGRTQAKLHAYNAVLLRVKSLHAWSDPGRTKVWAAAVSLLAAVLAIVPARYTFAALVLFLFTEPIRPETKNIAELLLEDFWEGLPVESGTHTNVRMAAIYSRHDSRWMD